MALLELLFISLFAYKSNTLSDIVGKDFVNKIILKIKGFKIVKKNV